MQVGYTIPSSILSKLKMTSARVYLSGQNLLTIKSNSLTLSLIHIYLDVGHLRILLYRKQETLLVLTLLADAIETVIIAQEGSLLA